MAFSPPIATGAQCSTNLVVGGHLVGRHCPSVIRARPTSVFGPVNNPPLSLIEPINAVADSAKWAKLETLRLSRALAPGNHIIRFKFAYDGGGIGKGATATLLVDEKQVAEGRIPQTIGVRFSLDETFDVGRDTGTPVLEEYESKMPFPFTGTLTKFVVVLEPQKLTEEEQQRLREQLAKAMETVQ
jgi:hypothetical protein